MEGERGVVRLLGEGRRVALGAAGIVVLKTEGRHSGGQLAAYEFAMPPRTAGPPLHLHRTWDEAFSVLDGEMTFLIDGRTHVCPAGSFVFVPRGVPHTFWNAGEALARQLTVFTPAGIECYFDAVAGVLAAGTPEALGEAEAVMAAHDMVVVPDNGPAYGALDPAGQPR
jgi:quercetin dioxygenase-like cupin family protein